MENGAGQFKPAAQFCRIGKISVVRQCHPAFLMVDLNGLAVISVRPSGGAVTHMRHCHLSFRQTGQGLSRKDFAHQPQIFMGGEQAVVIDYDPAAFLPPVLKRIQTIIAYACHIADIGSHHAKHAAFFTDTHTLPPMAFSNAAPINPLNRGWGLLGRLLNAGWYCTPT